MHGLYLCFAMLSNESYAISTTQYYIFYGFSSFSYNKFFPRAFSFPFLFFTTTTPFHPITIWRTNNISLFPHNTPSLYKVSGLYFSKELKNPVFAGLAFLLYSFFFLLYTFLLPNEKFLMPRSTSTKTTIIFFIELNMSQI